MKEIGTGTDMAKNEDIAQALVRDIPRGVASRFLKEQTAPQARWIRGEDILGADAIHYDPDRPGGKILLGAIGSRLVGIDDNRHVLTIAGSRAGKSVTLISNLLFYRGSVLCTDPKGELAEVTAMRRAALGQKVHILDPFGIVQGEAAQFRAGFNPLRNLNAGSQTIVEDALLVTDAMVVSSGNEKDPHWNESASHFIMGLILYVATSPFMADEERHLGTVRHLINHALSVEGEEGYFVLPRRVFSATAELKAKGYVELADVIEGAIRGFFDKGEEERGSVLSTVRRHTQFLDFFSMKQVLRRHDFGLEDLKRDPQGVSVYLVLPATKMGLCNRWLRLFINQLLEAMEREKNVPDVPVLLCLDEFPVLGFMKQLQDAAGQIASFGVRLWVIMQDWGQGKALYGERFESFAANSGVTQVFGAVDLATTEYFSKRLGQTLVEETEAPHSDETRPGLALPRRNRRHYPLMTADEIARSFARDDPLKRQLVLWAGKNPMILQRVEYYDDNSPIYRGQYRRHRT